MTYNFFANDTYQAPVFIINRISFQGLDMLYYERGYMYIYWLLLHIYVISHTKTY